MSISATPIADSYWVEHGRLLAGEYPGSQDEPLARARLRAFLCAGIDVFVDLTESRDGLEPYAALLAQESAQMGATTSRHHLPIRDMGVPTTEHLRAILRTIREEIDAGHSVYVHCWGGLGRTGLVVGAWLVEHGFCGDAALDRIMQLRQGTPDASRASPQTDEQRDLVRNWQPERFYE